MRTILRALAFLFMWVMGWIFGLFFAGLLGHVTIANQYTTLNSPRLKIDAQAKDAILGALDRDLTYSKQRLGVFIAIVAFLIASVEAFDRIEAGVRDVWSIALALSAFGSIWSWVAVNLMQELRSNAIASLYFEEKDLSPDEASAGGLADVTMFANLAANLCGLGFLGLLAFAALSARIAS